MMKISQMNESMLAMEKSKAMQIVKLNNHTPTFDDVWKKFKEITKNIAFSMVLDLFPITPLEMQSLQHTIKVAEPFYQFPSETQLLEIIIPQIYNQVKQKVINTIKSDLLKEVNNVALTIDGWNGRSVADYMSVTIHYWTQDFESRHLLLQLESLPRTWNTAQDLFHLIQNVLLKYGLSEEKTESVHIITANGNNIVKAISMNDSWTRIPCFARLFQQTVDDVLRSFADFDELVVKCRLLVAAVWTKSAADAQFNKANKLQSSCILDDIIPSWNSIFDIFDSLLKLRATFQLLLDESTLPANKLTDADWQSIKSYVQVFSLLKQASVLLSEEAYPPLSLYLPTIRGILELIESMNLNNQLSIQLIRSICSRFGHINTNESMIIAMVVDPRFKTRLLAEDEKFTVFDMVKSEMLSTGSDKTQLPKHTDKIDNFTDKSLKTYFTKMEGKKHSEDTSEKLAEAELTYYLCQDVVPMNTAVDRWWKENAKHFPKLAKLARIYLSIPAVQVSSERAFPNKRGFIIDNRAELLTNQVSVLDLMRISFLNYNLAQFKNDVNL